MTNPVDGASISAGVDPLSPCVVAILDNPRRWSSGATPPRGATDELHSGRRCLRFDLAAFAISVRPPAGSRCDGGARSARFSVYALRPLQGTAVPWCTWSPNAYSDRFEVQWSCGGHVSCFQRPEFCRPRCQGGRQAVDSGPLTNRKGSHLAIPFLLSAGKRRVHRSPSRRRV